MSNMEFITPIYISATNMVTPLVTISLDKLYTSALIFINILQIGIQTAAFMMKEGFTELFANASSILTNLTIEKIVYILIVYNLLILTAIDKQRRKITEQNEVVKTLNKEVNYLKKTERMREDMEELLFQDIKVHHEETHKKIVAMEKKIKKMEKEIKIYE